MKLIIKSLLFASLVCILIPGTSVTAAPPQGQAFWGSVTLDGSPAPDGTSVTAEMNGRQVASTTVPGNDYAYELTISTIEGDQAGDTIDFFVNGLDAGSVSFTPGAFTPHNLSATTPPPPPPPPPADNERVLTIEVNGQGSTTPSAGSHNYDRGDRVHIIATPASGWIFIGWTGSSVDDPASADTYVRMTVNKTITANFELGIDETPPIISGTSSSNVTKDSADISWTTNEPSTSQVDYATSPGELTPLDENLVISHIVHLSGLVPATTYTFTVMSQDASNNLATDGPYTFTTAGQPATFEISDWDISLTSSGSSYNVEFSFLLQNTGDLPGSYNAVLKIDGAEADNQTVELDGGTSEIVVCMATNDIPGNHKAELGSISLDFNIPVQTDGTDDEPTLPKDTNWELTIAIGAAVALTVLVVTLFVIRSRYKLVRK